MTQNLTKIKSNVPANLVSHYDAFSSQLIKSMNKSEALKLISGSLVLGIEYSGQKTEKSNDANAIDFISKGVYSEVTVQMPFLRIGHLQIAFTRGASGGFGKFFGINVNTCMEWIRSYLKSEEYNDANKQHLNKLETVDKPQISEDEKNAIMDKAVNEFFDEYKRTKVIPYYSYSVCNYINSKYGVLVNGKKTIVPNEEDRLRIRKESCEQYEAWVHKSAKEYKIQGKIADAKNLLSTLENYKNLGMFTLIQKRNAVKFYFDKLIKEQI